MVEIAAALGHSCARRSDGSVWCFGFNQYGQIGAPDDGSHRAGLTRVSLSGPATRIGCTGTMTCAAMDGANGDEVWCWGVGKSGPEPLRAAPPTHLLTGGAVREFVTSVERLCIVRASTFDEPSGGGCTADGSGVPGMGVEGFRLAQVMGGPWATMAISERTACAVDIRGVVSCWGDNANGQIGTGQAGDIWPNPTLVHW